MAQVMNTCSEVMTKSRQVQQASAPEEPGYYDEISDNDDLGAEDMNRWVHDFLLELAGIGPFGAIPASAPRIFQERPGTFTIKSG